MTPIETAPEILDRELTLDALAAAANQEHALCEDQAQGLLRHALRAGEHIAQALERIPMGGRRQWMSDNLQMPVAIAYTYRAIWRSRDELPPEVTSIRAANCLLQPARTSGPLGERWSPYREAARDLRGAGRTLTEIAEELGIARTTIAQLVSDKEQAAARVRNRRYRARRRAAREALKREEERKAARAAGGAIAELYALAERMQDILGQAHGEATDREARVALAGAGEHYRKMRDQIVRALGVS